MDPSRIDPSQLEPLGDRVVVETIKQTETRAGIVLPEIAQGRPETARVLAVGPGQRNAKTGETIPIPVEVGDIVMFVRHAGVHVGSFDDNHIIFREQDLLAKVHPAEEETPEN